jgi:hypothetical protein
MVGSVFVTVYLAAHGAHIFVHPLTGIPTAMFSAAASALGFTMIEDKIRSEVMAYDWGSASLKALSAILSEQSLRSKIATSRAETVAQVTAVLKQRSAAPIWPSSSASSSSLSKWQSLEELQRVVVAQFERVVNQVIEDLGVLEVIHEARK